MSAPLLATKITLPPLRSNLVTRPRLIAQLDIGWRQGRAITLVAAPAGYGKTTLVRSWLEPYASRTAWVALDANDGQPSRFWSYVIAALQTIKTGVGRDLQQVLQTQRFQAAPLDHAEIEAGLAALINDLAQLPDRLILILDDYHLIESHDVQRQVAFLIDHLPVSLHLIFATRADPLDLPIARWRARQQLTELRADDLRFTPDEAATFLNQAMGLSLTPADVPFGWYEILANPVYGIQSLLQFFSASQLASAPYRGCTSPLSHRGTQPSFRDPPREISGWQDIAHGSSERR